MMSPNTSLLLVACICIVLGTFMLSYRKSLVKEQDFEMNSEKNNRKKFNFSTDPIVLSRQKGYLLPRCQLPLHYGVQECANTSSIRFYLDVDTDSCLAFKYSGCGGNANNFMSWIDCMRCFAMDYSECPIGSEPVKNLNSNSSTCESRPNETCTGPNSYCSRGAFFGKCCDMTIRDKDENDRNTSLGCGPGMKKVAYESSIGYSLPLLGKTCESKFCPEKATCHQGNYFAYCCEPV